MESTISMKWRQNPQSFERAHLYIAVECALGEISPNVNTVAVNCRFYPLSLYDSLFSFSFSFFVSLFLLLPDSNLLFCRVVTLSYDCRECVSECTWRHDTFLVHWSVGNKIVIYCFALSHSALTIWNKLFETHLVCVCVYVCVCARAHARLCM